MPPGLTRARPGSAALGSIATLFDDLMALPRAQLERPGPLFLRFDEHQASETPDEIFSLEAFRAIVSQSDTGVQVRRER